MKNELHFDVNSIIKIEIHDRTKTSYKWLPARQRTWFFGFLKRNSWQDEGWYPYGCYEEGSMMGYSGEATPAFKSSLLDFGYQIDPDKSVWDRPHIDIYLKEGHSIRKKFETFEDAKEYVEDIKEWSDIKFYIIVNG